MNIDFNKLYAILENKTNKSINKLEELKCSTDDYKKTLEAILLNIKAFDEIKKYDTGCPDCKKATIEHKEEKQQNAPIKEEAPTSLIGKKWIPYKGGK
jgi:hypothetical protein